MDWAKDKRRMLSLGDLSSIYVAMAKPSATMVLSSEDLFITNVADQYQVPCVLADEFIINTIKDEKKIELYNLIKTA
jgi:hypothetical protein